jgi:dUTP pyrophosphatase
MGQYLFSISEALLTISVEYVLADPAFKPAQSVAGSAAYDVKAYLPDTCAIDPDIFLAQEFDRYLGKYPAGMLFANGNRIEFEDAVKVLKGVDPLLRIAVLAPGATKIINAGFKAGLSTDVEGKVAALLVCPRSGLACNHGVTVVNTPGIVDEDYPGWVGVGLINHGRGLHLLFHGARIAQVMFQEVCLPEESIVQELSLKGQRQGGFGHTGI